jgi:hypothetical protein
VAARSVVLQSSEGGRVVNSRLFVVLTLDALMVGHLFRAAHLGFVLVLAAYLGF